MAKISPEYLERYNDITEDVVAFLWKRHRKTPPGRMTRRTPAIAIARLFKLPGESRETLRRRCRELMIVVRERGYPVLADGRGYYMGSEPGDFIEYMALLRRRGLTYLHEGRMVRDSPAAHGAAGQLQMTDGDGFLFSDPSPDAGGSRCAMLAGR